MKTSTKMQEVITKLAEKHDLDLAIQKAHLRLDMPGFDRLVIEKTGSHQLSVAHYYEQMGRLIPDPEIIFFTGFEAWIPIEVTQVIGGHRVYAVLSADGKSLALVDSNRQKSLADFAEMWAQNIQDQGWLEDGIKWDPCDPTKHQIPDLNTLMTWEAEGICEAIDGCVVEPDGTCPHGCQSWLLVLGLI